MAQPHVSVIIPVFNRAAMVAEAIDSVLAQQDVHLEVIVVDDGSTDGTSAAIDAIAAEDSRVFALHQANAGPSAARNAAVDASRASWLTFLDSDDLMVPGRIAKQFAALEAHPNASAVIGLEQVEVAPGVEPPDIIIRRPPAEIAPYWYSMSMLLPRAVFDEVGRFDESMRIGEDTDLLARLMAANHQIVRVPETLVIRRIMGDNLVYGVDIDDATLDTIRRHLRRQRSG